MATGGKAATGGVYATGGTSSAIANVATPATYRGTAWINIDYSPFGLDEIDYELSVIVKVGTPLTISLTNIVDSNPVYLRIEPYPAGSVISAPKLGDFLFETSAKVSPSNPPGAFTDSRILRFWNTSIDDGEILGTMTDQHKEARVYFTNFFYLPDVITGSSVSHMISLGSEYDAYLDDETMYVSIFGTIDQPVVDPNTYEPILIQTPFYIDIEADLL